MALSPDTLYPPGACALQGRHDSRRLADRIAEQLARPALTGDDRAIIARQRLFFVATADTRGHPDCSCKGGAPDFVQAPGGAWKSFEMFRDVLPHPR